jgi:glycosyltransferase involved in cell wall biosynthesis
MPKPTVCQLLHGLTVGGAEVLAADLARRLSDRYRFVFACLDTLGELGQQMVAEGFPVEVLNRKPGVDLGSMRRLRAFWRRHHVQAVHAHQYTPFFYALAARAWNRHPPVLFTEHGRWYPDYPRWKRIVFNRLMLRKADRVVAVGESVRQALIRNEGFRPARVQVIYNGVRRDAMEHLTADRMEVRRELGIANHEIAIIQVARLDALKDHPTAIRTLRRIADAGLPARLLLVGEGPERSLIESEIARLELGSQVSLLGLRHDVARLLCAADIFLLTSISEGIPVTVLEAMAMRIPVVATDVGGLREIVLDGQTGFLCPAKDDAALAAAVARLGRDARLRSRMGQLASSRVDELFTQEQMHAAYEHVYRELLPR